MAAAACRALQREGPGREPRLRVRASCGEDAAPKGCAVHAGTTGAAQRCMFKVPEGDQRPSNALEDFTGSRFVGHPCPCTPPTGSRRRAGGSMRTTSLPLDWTRSDLGDEFAVSCLRVQGLLTSGGRLSSRPPPPPGRARPSPTASWRESRGPAGARLHRVGQ